MAKHRWKADVLNKSKRLGFSEDGWSGLAGTGTLRQRGGQQNLTPKKKHLFELSDSSSYDMCSEDESDKEDTETGDGNHLVDWNNGKPPPTHMIVEQSQLKKLFGKVTRCPDCGNSMELNVHVVAIASKLCVTCSFCQLKLDSKEPASASLPQFDDNFTRSSDFALNIL